MKGLKDLQSLRSVSSATIGQGLNFLAMLLPVFAQRGDQLAYLLVPLSLATVLHKVGFLCFNVRYLGIRREQEGIATATSFWGLVGATVVMMALAGVIALWSSRWAIVALAASFLIISHGLYFMAVTILIAENKLGAYGTGRLIYGVLNIGLTAAAVYLVPSRAGLIYVAFVLTSVIGVWMLSRADNKVHGFVTSHSRQAFGPEGIAYVKESSPVVGSTVVAEMGFQINGFFTPLMGHLQEMWAIVVRIAGGFATVGSQVLAPVFESKVSFALRNSQLDEAFVWVKRSQLAGIGFALATGLFQTLLIYVLYGGEYSWLIIVSGSLYSAAFLSSTVPGKMPFLMGRNKTILVWSLLRVGCHIPLFAMRDEKLFIAVCAVQLIFAIWLIGITYLPPKRSQVDAAAQVSEEEDEAAEQVTDGVSGSALTAPPAGTQSRADGNGDENAPTNLSAALKATPAPEVVWERTLPPFATRDGVNAPQNQRRDRRD
ncbi:hypothetical protein [Corynebacterium glaucum]|uniref:hypothetical protein n=1 Tax=Corynebacterium glaucum TaxID=187491 RepID=UPI002658A44B|nr:hypothetical protein [Corynebacterium glaucum]